MIVVSACFILFPASTVFLSEINSLHSSLAFQKVILNEIILRNYRAYENKMYNGEEKGLEIKEIVVSIT